VKQTTNTRYRFKKSVWRIACFLSAFFLLACSAQNVISEKQMRVQNAADTVVAELLFDKELEKTASYHVRKNGFVALHFDKSVADKVYTEVVESLRANPAISGVYAEQEGNEVCALP